MMQILQGFVLFQFVFRGISFWGYVLFMEQIMQHQKKRQALQKVIKIVSKKHLLRDFHHPVLQFLVFLDIVIV